MRPADEHEEKYAECLEAGQRFEDFVTDVLYRNGIPVVGHASRQYQLRGENKAGIEIKFDRRFAETRNLYIETEERSHPDRPHVVQGGIYRPDNSWLYLIGDRSILFIFSKTMLRGLHARGSYAPVEIATSRGFLLPELAARRYAARIIQLELNAARGHR